MQPGAGSCAVTAASATSVDITCPIACIGRRPAGLDAARASVACDLGAYLAEAARLAGASVDAFRILRDELRAHGAPKKLVRAATRRAG
ncbi:MAG: hypothetical protein ABI548_13815 [Polyangiaceae bacterium]